MPGPGTGFSLVELLVAMAVASLVSAGLLQAAQAGSSSYRLQANVSALAENARFALQAVRREATQAAYSEQPWAHPAGSGLEEAVEQFSVRGDLLAFRRRSDRNCYDNPNPVSSPAGAPAFFLRETRFEVSAGGNFALTCRYGPDPADLVTQVNRLGLVEHVESLQALYADDSDGDGRADRWVHAGAWSDPGRVLGLRVALLLASPERVTRLSADPLEVLDARMFPDPDGRLRRVFETAFALRGQLP